MVNRDINAESPLANAIRIAVPTDTTIPDYPTNLALYAFFEKIMLVFNNVLDKDVISYEYQLYEDDQVNGSYPNFTLIANATIYSTGTSGSNVFTIAVDNSTDVENIKYYGRVRTIDTSGNLSSWSPLVESGNTPLIEDQFIASLTAAKITAGTIGAHEIVLTQAGPQTNISAPSNMAILRSSNYNGSYNSNTLAWTNGTEGWIVAGDGHAEFSSASIRGGLKAGSVWIDTNNRWNRNSTDTANATEFKAGSSTKYLYFDGTDLTFTGNLSAAGGTFSGQITVASNTVKLGNNVGGSNETGVLIVSHDNSWYRRTDGSIFFSAGNATNKIQLDTSGTSEIDFNNGTFRVQNNGALTATNANITGTITANSGSISGNIVSGGTISGTSLDIGNGTFQVTSAGALTASNANISGTINATSGSIASWNITTNEINSNRLDGYNVYLTPGVTGPPEIGFVTPSSTTFGVINTSGIYFQDGNSKYFSLNSSNSEVTAVRNGVSVGINKQATFGGGTYNFVVQDLSNSLNRTFIGPTKLSVVSSSGQVSLDADFGITTGGAILAMAQVEGSSLIATAGGSQAIQAQNGGISVGGGGISYTWVSNLPGSRFPMAFAWDSGRAAVSFIVNNDSNVDGWILPDGFYSDRRLKENVSPINNNLLEKIYSVKIYEFDYNENTPLKDLRGKHDFGVMADEFEDLFPEIVVNKESPDEYKQVAYVKTIPLLLAAVSNLNKRVAELESR